jgi:two-component system response regulator AtoC
VAEQLTILVVDDDESTRDYLALLLKTRGYEVLAAGSGEEALERIKSGPLPDVVLCDLILTGMGGLEFLEVARQLHPALPVIVLSSVDKIPTVVDAMGRGAADYLTKPFEEAELELAIRNALEKQRLRNEVSVLKRRLAQEEGGADLTSASASMMRVRDVARQVADTDAPVLLVGETGVGKEVLARFMHEQSARRQRPLIKVNCAALPHDLLESELFGYERGAFSGALQAKPGKFEQALGGSILLDEIAEMGPSLQAKILHVLQDGEFTRLGGRQPIRSDARVFAATNRDLEQAVASGTFREDVYFRLNVVRIAVPPLRERREDIPLLTDVFLRQYAQRYKSAANALPAPVMEAFLRHDWPGNVRELENAVRRYLILPDVELALAELRQPRSQPQHAQAQAPMAEAAAGADLSLKRIGAAAAAHAERELVVQVLAQTRWNRREAARRLNISYKGLLNKIKRWSLEGSAEAPTAAEE